VHDRLISGEYVTSAVRTVVVRPDELPEGLWHLSMLYCYVRMRTRMKCWRRRSVLLQCLETNTPISTRWSPNSLLLPAKQ